MESGFGVDKKTPGRVNRKCGMKRVWSERH